MCARQRETCRDMIESSTRPCRRIVACSAFLRISGCNMIRIRCAAVPRLMAGHAVCRQTVVLPTAVARRALLAGVCARQRKARRGMIESSTRPCRRVVASRAILREPGRNMIRICCAVVPRLMAGHAVCRQTFVLCAAVARRALLAGMRSCQWKATRSVIKHGPCPCGCVVTNRTILREAGCNMVRIRCAVVPRLMAGYATGR